MRDTGTLQTNGKYVAVWRKMYKAVAAKPVVGMTACITQTLGS